MASAPLAWVSCLLVVVATCSGGAAISTPCIECLCEAISGGNTCVFGGGSCHEGVCGPYAITLPYWQDAGRPTVGLEDRSSNKAYEKCSLDITCAEATIRGYMNKFHQDCNGDGVENCWDYAAIHFHGGYGCNKPLSVPVRNALTNCLQRQPVVDPNQPVVDPNPPVVDPNLPVVDPNPYPFPDPRPDIPLPPDTEDPDHNDVVYPKTPTTFPTIDVRFGD